MPTATVTLKVIGKTITPASGHKPRTITFRFNPNAPLFLASLILKENTGIGTINGVISPGTDAVNNTGFANADLPTNLFSAIWDFASHNASLTVSITYDDVSFVISEIEVTASSQIIIDAEWVNSP